MALIDRHPEYVNRLGEWIQIRDTYKGSRHVKAKRTEYLPATEGMIQDGMTGRDQPGWKDYEAYLKRAHFYDVVKEAVKAMIGILHMKPAVIKLPKRMEQLRENATIQGEGLQMLLQRINEAQFLAGRLGLLADAPTGMDPKDAIPYIAFYDAERIINWDAGKEDEGENQLELVVIDESGLQREGFTWMEERKYRVLARSAAALESGWTRPGPDDKYMVCVKVNDSSMPIPSDFEMPSIAGRPMDDIPFIFIGSDDLLPEPNEPPLLGLSDLSLTIYRADADYRQTLYMQGQNTLVIIGGEPDDVEGGGKQIRIGAGGMIGLRIGGSAEYIGTSAAGLGEMRQSLERDRNAAEAWGLEFMDGDAHGESGEALRVRVAARTTTLSTVARVGGAGLEQILKKIAVWMGENPDEVSVCPNVDFADQTVQGAMLLAFMQAKQLGLPLSLKSIHRLMHQNDLTEMDFEQENTQIEQEAMTLIGMMVNQAGVTDDSYLDDESGDTPGAIPPIPTIPGNNNVPVTPHTRGSPTPLKTKVGPKGASAGK
jgi:hypothetical protein